MVPTAGDGYPKRFLAVLDRIDAQVDQVFAPWRGRPIPDVAAAVVSTASDHGFVWMVLAGYRARHPGPARWRAVGGLALAGCSSFAVNRVVKRAVGRDRPDARTGSGAVVPPAGPGQEPGRSAPGRQAGLPVRTPTSSSFPSGHTLAATCAALTLGIDAADAAALGAVALAVAASRVHLRHHHPSDVLGGLLIGGALACVTRPLAGRIGGRRGAPKPARPGMGPRSLRL